MSDRDLVMRWVRGWADLRSARIEPFDGWPLVHVDGVTRDTEIVCVDPGRAAFERLAQHTAHDSREMLTVFGRDLAVYQAPPLPPGLRVASTDEVLMTTTLAPSAAPRSGELSAQWVTDGARATYMVHDGDRVAAEGQVGIRGTDAIFDRIETSPRHRRRGLGRHVMSALTTWASDHGATFGLLTASVDGARLYAAIGWDAEMAMWSLMGVDDS